MSNKEVFVLPISVQRESKNYLPENEHMDPEVTAEVTTTHGEERM